MAFELKQQLKLSQQLVMTPQLQQAIRLLQLNRLELANVLREEMLENPILEEGPELEEEEKKEVTEKKSDEVKELKGEGEGTDDFDWENYVQSYKAPSGGTILSSQEELPAYDNILTKRPTLSEHLLWQLKLASINEEEEFVGTVIIGNLDENGYLRTSISEISSKIKVSEKDIELVLKRIQEFDPLGIGARNLTESLIIQSRKFPDRELIEKIVTNHLKDLENKNYRAIQRSLGIPNAKVVSLAKKISKLEPKPGRPFYDENYQYITPDIYVYKSGSEFIIVLNEDGLPKLKISPFYREVLSKKVSSTRTKEYIHDKLRSALWLIRSIHQRQRTIFKVAESIVKFQTEFLDKGVNVLKPMVLKEVADDIDMHESTISRVTANKYMHTPQGIFELKFFFSSGVRGSLGDNVAAESVKDRIKQIILREDSKKPYSDQDIVDMLEKQNISLARRTVAKYREMLGVLSSSKRKKVF